MRPSQRLVLWRYIFPFSLFCFLYIMRPGVCEYGSLRLDGQYGDQRRSSPVVTEFILFGNSTKKWFLFESSLIYLSTHFLFISQQSFFLDKKKQSGNVWKVPKNWISDNFEQFWEHLTYSNTPYSTNTVHFRAHILPKVSIN